ncbi:Rieske (2Fe-2S) protein [Mycolicibacterium arenosum]|uniref:Rieske 2Fe-2S domain-containing protein n=1 Tax=Mycolicibacterium arenosum TaxID=2952157 RepID=A0ABT1MB85_9MYCO|nr:Rieske 2Fe-2S domain-containing protein [Mycolicibacterium sp. CAU 1645]MCP9276112.1 Rieske 2Fe-2S domain-containing protein [Mycolicibacterium sp. CAU 1645]
MTTEVTVGRVDEIPVGEGRTYTVNGEQIAIYRMRDGSLRAVDAVCPHRGGPLADGLIDDAVVVCPLHGRTYDLTTGDEVSGGPGVCAHTATAAPDGSIRLALERG